MTKLSVIILAYTNSESVYKMNCDAVNSLLISENWQNEELSVRIMESNKKAPYSYPPPVVVEYPEIDFNFHAYFNLGLRHTDGEFVAFCNNDIIFEKGWFSAILNVSNLNSKFLCFSPLDDKYKGMTESELPRDKDFYCGWDYGKYFAMWCFVWKRSVFEIIGEFDETFSFYAADADETNTLRKNAIYSVVCTKSIVRHISSQTAGKTRTPITLAERDMYPLTMEEIRRGYSWLWDDVRFYEAYQKEVAKWGNIQMLLRVQKLILRYPWLNRRYITKVLYNRKVNHLLCILTGIVYK